MPLTIIIIGLLIRQQNKVYAMAFISSGLLLHWATIQFMEFKK